MSKKQLKIIIIGAGPVGLVLAMRLKQLGFTATVYEERTRSQITAGNDERSVNITLSCRGMSALNLVGCDTTVMCFSARVEGRKYFFHGDPYFMPYTLLPDHCLYSIKRKKLEDILIQQAEKNGIEIVFNHKMTGINFNKNACIFLHDKNIKEIPYDFLFGTDGAHSRVRSNLHTSCVTTEHEFVYKRIEVDFDNARALGLDTKSVNIWLSNKGMFLTLPNNDDSHSGLLHLKSIVVDAIDTEPDLLEEFFPVLVKNISDFKTKYFQSAIGAFGSIACEKWFWRSNILLMGDAAHAMVPFYGQGTNCGLEDTTILCNLIADNSDDIKKAAHIFEKSRPKSTSAISNLSLKNLKNLEVEMDFEEHLTMKYLELEIEKRYSDYHSEYFMVAFSHLSYDEALNISNKCHHILAAYAKHTSIKGKVKFAPEILEEIHEKLRHSLNSN